MCYLLSSKIFLRSRVKLHCLARVSGPNDSPRAHLIYNHIAVHELALREQRGGGNIPAGLTRHPVRIPHYQGPQRLKLQCAVAGDQVAVVGEAGPHCIPLVLPTGSFLVHHQIAILLHGKRIGAIHGGHVLARRKRVNGFCPMLLEWSESIYTCILC